MTSTIDPPPGAGMLAYHTDTEWWGVISSVGQDSLSVLWFGTDTPTSVPRHAVTVHAELPSCDDATLRALGRAQLAVARVHASNDARARGVIADYREQRAPTSATNSSSGTNANLPNYGRNTPRHSSGSVRTWSTSTAAAAASAGTGWTISCTATA